MGMTHWAIGGEPYDRPLCSGCRRRAPHSDGTLQAWPFAQVYVTVNGLTKSAGNI